MAASRPGFDEALGFLPLVFFFAGIIGSGSIRRPLGQLRYKMRPVALDHAAQLGVDLLDSSESLKLHAELFQLVAIKHVAFVDFEWAWRIN